MDRALREALPAAREPVIADVLAWADRASASRSPADLDELMRAIRDASRLATAIGAAGVDARRAWVVRAASWYGYAAALQAGLPVNLRWPITAAVARRMAEEAIWASRF